MMNTFQKWLKKQGYTREFETWGAWMKDGKAVEGSVLNQKLKEFEESNEIFRGTKLN